MDIVFDASDFSADFVCNESTTTETSFIALDDSGSGSNPFTNVLPARVATTFTEVS